MPSILLPNVIAEQERIEREIQAKRRAEQDTPENRIIREFLEMVDGNPDFTGHELHHYSCWSCKAYKEQLFDENGLQRPMRKWFRMTDYILHEWKTERIIIVFKRKTDGKLLELAELFLDDERCVAFFENAQGTPDEDRFYVLRYVG